MLLDDAETAAIGTQLVNLAVSFGGGVLAALFTFGWIWRTRDRQIARVGSLAQLEASNSLDIATKAAIAKRINDEVEDILKGDGSRRPRAVQQFVYLLLAAVFFIMLYWGQSTWADGNRVAGAALMGAGLLAFVIAVGITGVPSHRWRMPKFLVSYSRPGGSPGRRSPVADIAIQNGPVAEGDRVAVLGGERDSPTSTAGIMEGLRFVVGDTGVVVAATAGQRAAEWLQDGVLIRGWENVTVLAGEVSGRIWQRVGGAEELRDLQAVVVDTPLASTTDELPHNVARLASMLAEGDGAVLVQVKPRWRRSSLPREEDIDAALRTAFDGRVLRSPTSRVIGTLFMAYNSDERFESAPLTVLRR